MKEEILKDMADELKFKDNGNLIEGQTLIKRVDLQENNRLLAENTKELVAHSHRQDVHALLLKIIAIILLVGVGFTMWVVAHIITEDVIGNIIRGLA